jgi:hypothetical protein
MEIDTYKCRPNITTTKNLLTNSQTYTKAMRSVKQHKTVSVNNTVIAGEQKNQT